MTDELQERIGANESVFRQINEGIERGQWPGEEDSPVGFRCECARLGCNELLELSVHEYEDIRAHSRRFIVVPGHERPDFEVVVDRQPGYLVVQKLDQAGETAVEKDPRR
ncbi:MAG TPA: hypothetical protein VMP89_02245 [Solirubrobacteraceae bacterium]|nr:hypothetical protein [Solirubrobacteraceae bacterium]